LYEKLEKPKKILVQPYDYKQSNVVMTPTPSIVYNSDSSSSSSIDEDNVMEDAPEEFICPLTLCIMTDPVVSKDGKNFDRAAILKWLAKGHENCPLTRQPLHLSSLVPNHKLRRSIQQWQMEQGFGGDDKKYDNLVHPTKNLASLGLVMEFTDDMMKNLDVSHRQRQQKHQPGTRSIEGFSDLLALYDEILDLTDDSRNANSSSNDNNDTIDMENSIDAELRDIREMFDEVLELGQGISALSFSS
jgi:hypothetical protein